ncbi:MAG: nicotinamide riboside transporter PnuC [Cellvibrionaceae bacterium]
MDAWIASLGQSLGNAWQLMSLWELAAVILAIAYLLLAAKESLWCWYAAFISTAIFTLLFWDASLLMESGLQIYYLGMAVFGWYQWKQQSNQRSQPNVKIHTWSAKRHTTVIALVITLSLISGYFLSNYTEAAWPFVDSFTTWGSVVTTYMVTRKVLENWLYWLVIDTISIFLYWDRGLHLTALLFVAYLVICTFGYIHWRRQLQSVDRATSALSSSVT